MNRDLTIMVSRSQDSIFFWKIIKSSIDHNQIDTLTGTSVKASPKNKLTRMRVKKRRDSVINLQKSSISKSSEFLKLENSELDKSDLGDTKNTPRPSVNLKKIDYPACYSNLRHH